ncbi:MAG TPA: 2-dehydropantoate 2-reductase N-terminal domain-containing protein [Bacteroidales bacterium]|nr:2-dehydropantoate 2-reductase N-terminal domain-containing protein [Bacteroidales bacterium]
MKHSHNQRIVFVGSGAIATALGNILASDEDFEVQLLSQEPEVIASINQEHVNEAYFPNIQLTPLLKATADKQILTSADLVFLAIPSVAVTSYLEENKELIPRSAILVNLAKGFGPERRLLPDAIADIMPNALVSLKGPSFAREILNRQPTALTAASENSEVFEVMQDLFDNTPVYLDFSTDIRGVEYASILKNIYAIVIGIVDANFDSPNLRSLVISRSINEMRSLLVRFGGQEKTIFNYCGFGDFSLTALNDLSRNRTLGLLIGKGFFTQGISEKVVLEGRIAVNVFHELLTELRVPHTAYPIMYEVHKVFNVGYDIKKFVKNILENG